MIQMKQQFKFNPLATAIFTLLCGSSLSSYAESTQGDLTTDNQNLKAAINESYPGEAFFSQYYVNKDAAQTQLRPANDNNNRWCKGVWTTPFGPDSATAPAGEGAAVITADRGYYNPNGDSILEGDVLIDQQGRMVRADKVMIDQSQTYAQAQGNVQLAQQGLIAQSDEIKYNLKDQTGQLDNSFYISEENRAHGHANKIERVTPSQVVFEDATYTTCAPELKPTWQIKAEEIKLDQDTGRGTTRNTRLYIKDVPVLAVPYFNFPIDDRRTTGLLNPSFGYSSEAGFQIGAPVYLNLAPHYDATVTPIFYSSRGLMLNGEFRYLTENFGQGRIFGGYLPSDRKYNKEDRKDLHIFHRWDISPQWSTNVEYNYVSDKDFFNDLDNNPDSKTDLNQRRAWELNYANGVPGLTAKLRVEDFQTLDKAIKQVDRPYARLPQFLLNYVTGDPLGLQFEFNNDTAYFKKNLEEFEGLAQPSGTRIYNQAAARYNFRNQWAFAIPEVSVRTLNTIYDQDTIDNMNNNQHNSSTKDRNLVVPQMSLDMGLNFEREGKYLQTLSPRMFYAYAPYKDQSNYPNFDSTTASINYDQLFNPYRFYGHDRLEDNNFLSLGLSYSLFDTVGLEKLRASVGQSFYFDDRRVSLGHADDQINREKKTGPVISLSSQITENFRASTNASWMSNGNNAHRDFQVSYNGQQGSVYSVGYYFRDYLEHRQSAYDQFAASFIQPIHNNWRLMGHVQYDIDQNEAREYLLGVNYESCCWGVSIYGRSYYNDLDDIKNPDVKPKRAVMAEFTLKGLGGLNNRLGSLLQNRIVGYDKVNQNWTH